MASLESFSMARESTSGEGAKPLDCKERDTIDREQSYRLVFFISSFCFRCIIGWLVKERSEPQQGRRTRGEAGSFS